MACALTQTSMAFLFDALLGLVLQLPLLVVAVLFWLIGRCPGDKERKTCIDSALFRWFVSSGKHSAEEERTVDTVQRLKTEVELVEGSGNINVELQETAPLQSSPAGKIVQRGGRRAQVMPAIEAQAPAAQQPSGAPMPFVATAVRDSI